jgi:protein TonB
MVFTPPRLQSPPRPRYPSAARRLRQAARVRVRVLVDIEGKVIETELPGPDAGFGFDSAAETAAKRARWLPATRNGEPVESWTVLTIEFQP